MNSPEAKQGLQIYFARMKIEESLPIQTYRQQPLKGVAAVNTIRNKLWQQLVNMGLPVECGSGGRTKYNHIRQNLPQKHRLESACVGQTGESIYLPDGFDLLH